MKRHTRSLALTLALACAGTIAMAGHANAAAIAHWSFDSSISTTTTSNDSIGTNHLTRQDANVTFGNSGGAFGGFMADTSNTATAYALMTTTIVLGNTVNDANGWAISFWLNNWDFNDVVLGANTNDTNNKLFTRGTTTDPRIQIRDIGAGANITATGANVDNTDNWTHFAFVREGDGTANLYVDGTVYSGTGTQTVDFSINSLGFGGGTNGYIGDLDEVWIFGTALTSGEVNSLMTNNNIVPEPSAALLGGLGLLALLRRRR